MVEDCLLVFSLKSFLDVSSAYLLESSAVTYPLQASHWPGTRACPVSWCCFWSVSWCSFGLFLSSSGALLSWLLWWLPV